MPFARNIFYPRALFNAGDLATSLRRTLTPFMASLSTTILDTCGEFQFQLREDDGVAIVHEARLTAARDKNILTIWVRANHIDYDVRPRPIGVNGLQRYDAADPSVAARITQRCAYLAGL
jgi:hypothetical protein